MPDYDHRGSSNAGRDAFRAMKQKLPQLGKGRQG